MPVLTVNGTRPCYEATGAGALLVHDHAWGGAYLDPLVRAFVGEHDPPCLATRRFMADGIKGARHVMIPGTGRLTNLEASAAFNAAVTRCLAR